MGRSATRAITALACFSLLVSIAATLPAQEISSPADLVVEQIGYGVQPEVLLTWSNPDLYDDVVIAVDGVVVPATVDGVQREARVHTGLGSHDFALRGRAGGTVSVEIASAFEVLWRSPVENPVTQTACEFLAQNGGELHLDWRLGSDEWVRGRLEIPRFVNRFDVEAGATGAVLPALGGRPYTVLMRFLNADGYFSEPIVTVCQVLTPAFRRGDCDTSGRVNIADPVFLLNTLFLGAARGQCDDACDTNDDNELDITDPISTLIFLFQKGAPPPYPGARKCGIDLSDDFLGGNCVCF
jgi:hypothetical protein